MIKFNATSGKYENIVEVDDTFVQNRITELSNLISALQAQNASNTSQIQTAQTELNSLNAQVTLKQAA